MADAVVVAQAPAAERRPAIVAWASRSNLAAMVFWVAAAASWSMVIAKARTSGGDFSVIWMGINAFDHGQNMYLHEGSTYAFLYPPSAGLLLAPVGAVPEGIATAAFAVVQASMILLACILALKLVGRLESWSAPLAVLAGSLALPAANSMWLGNLDGVVVALELVILLAAARNRWIWAAVAFGSALALKPVLLPLVVVFLLARQWKTLLVGLAIPVGLSVMAVALGADGGAFLVKVVPYLWNGQSGDYQLVNISIAGAARYIHLAPGLALAARMGVLATLAVCLLSAWRTAGALGDRGVQLAEGSSILMLGALLAFSYSWAHYILFLLPLFALYGLKRSIVHGWMATIALYLLLFPDDALWSHVWLGLSQVRLIVGMLLLAAALAWALASRPRGTRKDKLGAPAQSADASQ